MKKGNRFIDPCRNSRQSDSICETVVFVRRTRRRLIERKGKAWSGGVVFESGHRIQWLESFRSRGPLLLRSLAQSKRGVYTVSTLGSQRYGVNTFPSPSRALLDAVCTIPRGFAQRSRNACRAFRKMRRGQGQGQVHSRIITLSISSCDS